MEKFSQKENNVLNFNLSYLFNTNKNRDFIPYNNNINERSQNNKTNLNNKEYTQKNENRPFIFNTNPFFLNMLRYNYNPLINQKGNNGINSLLLDFNNELREEYENEEKNINNKNDINNNNKNNSYDFTPLIKKLESQKDERFVKSRFLKFIKDINSNKIIINEEKNIIEENKDIIKEIHNEKSIEDLETNELEELLNKAKKYIDYSREDLAINILETIFDNSLIKLEKNKKYLEKAYIYIIICNLNMNEYLIAISLIIDLLNLIKEEKEQNYNNKYLEKEYIEKINRRDFDIGDKTQYENYENDKNKIKKEIENLIKKIISTNNKENYNEMLLLLYGLILYLNENYIEAEQAFSQLIILNDQNYFYFNILGVINANKKKDEEAIKYYKKALEVNKEYPKCLINYGVILSNQGKIKESCGYIISALKIFDDIPEAWNLLLSNVIDLDEEEIICEINNRNLINIEKSLLINK